MSTSFSYRRLIAEAAAIVVSILLAFAIDASWDARGERRDAEEVLRALEQEISVNLEVLREAIALGTEGRENLKWFVASGPEAVAAVPGDRAWNVVVQPMLRGYTTELSTGVLDATESSGRLTAIRDAGLRATLTHAKSRQSDAESTYGVVQQFNQQALAVLGGVPGVRAQIVRPDSLARVVDAETLAALALNEDLKRIATAKIPYWGAYLTELRRLQESLESALRTIRGDAE